MFAFLLGLVVGYVAKVVYDLVQEERYPPAQGISPGRAEAVLDETQAMVREIRDSLRARS